MRSSTKVKLFGVVLTGFLLLLPFGFLLTMAAQGFISEQQPLAHLIDTILSSLITQTVMLSLGVMLLTSTMGVLTAWWVSAHEFPGRRLLEWLLFLPMAMPSYVIAYAYTDALQYSGPIPTMLRAIFGPTFRLPDIRSLWGAVLVLGLVLYPYVYLMTRNAFLNRSPSMLDAARSLGHGSVSAFLKVGLPVARPAWVAGLALVLMETLAEYGALSYFGVQTFTTGIFTVWLNLGDRQGAALLAVMLLAVMLLLMAAEGWARGRAQYYSQQGKAGKAQRRRLGKASGYMVSVLCFMPVALGFFLPVGFLIHLNSRLDDAVNWVKLGQYAWHSASLALMAAVVSLLIAIFLSYKHRQSNHPIIQGVFRLVALGYGVPGSILAIAILIPLGMFDQLTYAWGWTMPALTGSVWALIYAYNVRFTSGALQSVDSGLQRITPHIDETARVLGRSPRQVLWQIHVPILRGSLATGLLLVIVDVIKELPATLVLRPFDFDTLAVISHHYAADERLAEAAMPALMIVAIALIPIVVLIRQGVREQAKLKPA